MFLDLEKFDVYIVGGYVRDRLLGLTPNDHDFVVVGATPDDMIEAGFQPIEASFPIFLHPETGDEYALARKERKVGVGYHGFECIFDPTVTIEEDLYRRDLTVNAMARKVLGWNEEGHAQLCDDVVDPYGGIKDLKAGLLRHVSEAFAEDPVRVLRTARFAARYNFNVDLDTLILMASVAHELNHVPQERIWAEFEKGLMEASPWIMFEVLNEVQATATSALSVYKHAYTHAMRYINTDTPLDVRFVLAAVGFKGTDYAPHRIPTELERVSDAFNTDFADLCLYITSTASERFSTLTAMRAITDDTKLFKCMDALTICAHVAGQISVDAVVDTIELMKQDLANIRTVDAAAIAATCANGLEIKHKLIDARIAAMS